MLGLFKRAPKLEAVFRPTVAVARELTREVEVAGEFVLRNLGRAAELTDLELVLIGGGTRRIDLAVPEAWRGRQAPAARDDAGVPARERVTRTRSALLPHGVATRTPKIASSRSKSRLLRVRMRSARVLAAARAASAS